MNTRNCRLFFIFLSMSLHPTTAAAQTIAADHFDGIEFDLAVPAAVTVGQAVPLSASLLQDDWHEAVFSFRPLLGDGESDAEGALDFFVQHLPGRIDRTLVFANAQAGTYELVVFAGAANELDFRGAFSPFVVQPSSDPPQLPVLFFDGIRLDAPVSTVQIVGATTEFAGQIQDDRIASARLDLSRDGADLGSVSLPLAQGRFQLPLRLPASEGTVLVQLVVGLVDGTFWGRGAFAFEVVTGDQPVAAPTMLSVALLPGGHADVELDNQGTGPLDILDASTTSPFEVVFTTASIAAGERGTIGVRYNGSGDDEGELVITSNDPLRPQRRIALRGVADGERTTQLAWERADAEGKLLATAPVGSDRFVLALFSPRHLLDNTSFAFSAGPPPPAARAAGTATSWTARQLGEATRARKAAHLAAEVRRLGRPSRRAAQTAYQVGDSRSFIFDDFAPVARQSVPVRVVAVSERGVAFVHTSTSADGGDLSVQDIGSHLAVFDADYDRIVASFGAPSDVDGDGRIAFLYTPLVDDIGLGGFQDPASVLDEAFGGSGNQTDLLFLSPTQPASSYRSLLVHEFQHLINFHQHVLVRGGESEASWLNEGLSHVSEDLVDGFVSGGNSDNVRDFLADPAAVGLTGLSDRDAVEAATGVPFRELLAGYAVRIYASGTGLAGHSRFSFAFPGLGGAHSRGFPLPATLRMDGGSINGSIRPRGIAFVEVATPSVLLQSPAEAELGAVLLPVPADFVASVDIPVDHFGGILFEPPLPGLLRTGDEIIIRGQLQDPTPTSVTVQFTADDGSTTSLLIRPDEQGRFDRSLVFDHSQAGVWELDVFVGDEDVFAGGFSPVQIQTGSGPVLLPRRFFDRVVLDTPLSTRFITGRGVTVSGMVDPDVDAIIVELVPDSGERLSFQANVEANRFALEILPPGSVTGNLTGEMRLFTHVDGEFLFAGAFAVTVGGAMTAVTEETAVVPAQFALLSAYPNPFNSAVVIPLQLDGDGIVELAVHALSGQHLRTLHHGWLPAGMYKWSWDGTDAGGAPAASGVYLLRAVGVNRRADGKILLLR